MQPFYLYILKCSDGSYYTGHTDNIEKRISEHTLGVIKGYTSKRLPVKVVYVAQFASRYEAIAAERKIKGWSRKKKKVFSSKFQISQKITNNLSLKGIFMIKNYKLRLIVLLISCSLLNAMEKEKELKKENQDLEQEKSYIYKVFRKDNNVKQAAVVLKNPKDISNEELKQKMIQVIGIDAYKRNMSNDEKGFIVFENISNELLTTLEQLEEIAKTGNYKRLNQTHLSKLRKNNDKNNEGFENLFMYVEKKKYRPLTFSTTLNGNTVSSYICTTTGKYIVKPVKQNTKKHSRNKKSSALTTLSIQMNKNWTANKGLVALLTSYSISNKIKK